MFNTGASKTTVPKQAVFTEGGSTVVTGSDNGKAYVFDRGGNPDEVLVHAKDGYAQTVTVRRQVS